MLVLDRFKKKENIINLKNHDTLVEGTILVRTVYDQGNVYRLKEYNLH